MKVRSIEISFGAEVELPEGWDRALDALIDMVCKKYEESHPDRVMWPAGCGSKPQWSATDAMFLGVRAQPGAPESGEPTFDDSVYYVEVSEREDLHGTNKWNPNRVALSERVRHERHIAQQENLRRTVERVEGEAVGSTWRHKKTGHVYQILGFGLDESWGRPVVYYQCKEEHDSRRWTRDAHKFFERFERIS